MLNKVRLLTPGPTPLPERVRLALAKDMIHHRKSEFMAIMGRVQEGLRTLFGTAGTVLPLGMLHGLTISSVYGNRALRCPNKCLIGILTWKLRQRI